MAKALMLQGTSSNVGKSVITTALCRIFYQDCWRVVPFKAQNMALNSFVTLSGGEIGRAQAVQAQACGLLPEVEMNPILLKPTGNSTSQVIVLGRPVGNMSAIEYHSNFNTSALGIIAECLAKYHQKYEIIVIEGAGSPVEVNLKSRDIVNMRIAKMADAPVILVADIDRGGALASIVGTLELLDPDERDLVAGIIINKFRGDIDLLKPALDFLEQKTGKQILGVLPFWSDLQIPQEDSVELERFADKRPRDNKHIDIAVIKLPRISNFTDFEPFICEPDVQLRYVQEKAELGKPDLVIIPGSKNTIEDLIFLEEKGLAAAILQATTANTPLIGICGGFQMLGEKVEDPHGMESAYHSKLGLGLIPMSTRLHKDKITTQITAVIQENTIPWLRTMVGETISGYEIHMGRSELQSGTRPVFILDKPAAAEPGIWDGAGANQGMVFGTYLHGLFENDGIRWSLINWLRERRGWAPLERKTSYLETREHHYNLLADIVRKNINMSKIYQLLATNRN